MLIHTYIKQVFTKFCSETLMMGLQIVTLAILVQRAEGTYPRSSAVLTHTLDLYSSSLICESFFVCRISPTMDSPQMLVHISL